MVSVIIPVYNVEKYIEQCINSILNQTYKNIEIVIVDDGSTDNSYNIIKKYIKSSDNIRYIKQDNQGVSEARNKGLNKARGEFILFVDPDDYLELDCIEKMINKIKSTQSDIVISGFRAFYENKKNADKYHIYSLSDKVYNSEEVINMLLEQIVKGYVWDKLFRRESLIKHNFKFEKGRYVQDWFPVFKEIYMSRTISFIDSPLYNYRLREGSTVHKRNMKITEDYYHATMSIKEYIINNHINVNKRSMNTFKINTFYNLIRNYYVGYEHKNKRKVYKSFKNSDYNKSNIHLKDILLNNNSSKIVKIKIIMWKLKIFHIIYLVKK